MVGVFLGVFSDRFAFFDAGDGKAVGLFWTLYNIFVLTFTIIVCVELLRRERHIANAPERAEMHDGTGWRQVWLANLSSSHARIRGRSLPADSVLTLRIEGVGDVAAVSLSGAKDGTRVQLLMAREQADALQLRLFAEANTPGVMGARTWRLFGDFARRLAFKT